MIIGVEVEFHVEGDPNEHSVYETPYQVIQSHLRNRPQGVVHSRHGEMVEEIHQATNGSVRVGYDATASFGDSIWEGWELSSIPLDVESTLSTWRNVYRSESKRYLNADPEIGQRRFAPPHHSCGMHIHLSGEEVNEDVIERISRLVNNVDNEQLVSYIAGRYNTQFCKIVEPEAAFFRCLFHSIGCRHRGKIDKRLINTCCANSMLLYEYMRDMDRHTAVNYVPHSNTGAIELRLFSAPNEFARLAANIQFAEALVNYSIASDNRDSLRFCSWLEDIENRRHYRHLFRHLRERNFVRGLIPRAR